MSSSNDPTSATASANGPLASSTPEHSQEPGGVSTDVSALTQGAHNESIEKVVGGPEKDEVHPNPVEAEADIEHIGGHTSKSAQDLTSPSGEARSPHAEDVEREASEHLARRAATMQINDDNPEEDPAPATMTIPPVVANDSTEFKDGNYENDYTEKVPLAHEETTNDVPEAPKGSQEATGAEIQNIMDQFHGNEAMAEDEIMSPRLERQQPMLVLPPRTSSLEKKDTPATSVSTSGDKSSNEAISPEESRRPTSITSSTMTQARTDDSEANARAKTGSIFQPPPPSPDAEPTLPFDFHRFLEQLRHRTADPVARFLRSFLSEFGKKQWMVHEQVKIISDFLEFITKKMAQCEVWRTVSDAEFDNAREGMEKLVMNRLYSQTFSPAIPPLTGSPRKSGRGGRSQAESINPHGPGRRGQHQEDVERDEVIAQKIRIYGWIRGEHLDIKPINEKGRKFLLLAQQELLKINTYRAPRDKVICVLNACKVIFGFLRNSKSDQSADALIPLLIYTVLRARPEHLVSNVQYIWRFRSQEKLGGEAGYYMSSLMAVVAFIENLDRTNLTITDEEFEKEVEQAVSAIAEKNKAEEYEEKSHTTAPATPLQRLSEKSALSNPEVTPRNSMEAEQVSPRKNAGQRHERGHQSSNSEIDDLDAVTGLLRTIQKPLSSIGRMFSDESSSLQQQNTLRPARTPQQGSSPRVLSPAPQIKRTPSESTMPPQPPSQRPQQGQQLTAAEAEARQASAEVAQAQKLRAKEYKVVVDTLRSMFPNLDEEVIQDVVRAQEGNVGRAVDACLALSAGN